MQNEIWPFGAQRKKLKLNVETKCSLAGGWFLFRLGNFGRGPMGAIGSFWGDPCVALALALALAFGAIPRSLAGSGSGSGPGCCPPTVVVKTRGFTLFLRPWIKKAFVVILFLQL